MKKSVSMLLAALMLTGALAGCGSSASGTQAADGADSGVSGAITVISREDGSGTRGAFIELTGVETAKRSTTPPPMRRSQTRPMSC